MGVYHRLFCVDALQHKKIGSFGAISPSRIVPDMRIVQASVLIHI